MGKTDAEDVPGISLNDKHQKLSTRGREQRELRPMVALLAAAVRATCGREQITKFRAIQLMPSSQKAIIAWL